MAFAAFARSRRPEQSALSGGAPVRSAAARSASTRSGLPQGTTAAPWALGEQLHGTTAAARRLSRSWRAVAGGDSFRRRAASQLPAAASSCGQRRLSQQLAPTSRTSPRAHGCMAMLRAALCSAGRAGACAGAGGARAVSAASAARGAAARQLSTASEVGAAPSLLGSQARLTAGSAPLHTGDRANAQHRDQRAHRQVRVPARAVRRAALTAPLPGSAAARPR